MVYPFHKDMHEELLNYYQNYLVTNKKAGKATVKNYIADVRKFLTWYETRYNLRFIPKSVTKNVAEEYLNQGQITLNQGSAAPTPSASSLKRYASSLRKFYEYLKLVKLAETNPFEISQAQNLFTTDPWHLKEFRNFLFLSNVSKVTLKNYAIDIQQFTQWAQQVISPHVHAQTLNVAGPEMPAVAEVRLQRPVDALVLKQVDSSLIEEYKKRLLHEANLSPVSINRKLSSLRKYFGWAEEQGFLKSPVSVASAMPQANFSQAPEPEPLVQAAVAAAPLSLEDLREIELEKQAKEAQKELAEQKTYSRFAPLRLLQKTGRGMSLAVNALLLTPIDKSAEAVRYTYWKLSGRKVFGTIEEVIGTAAPIAASEAVNQLQASNSISQAAKTAKLFSLLGQKFNIKEPAVRIKGFPKSFYAPLALSTANLPFHKKMWLHMRHARPHWYHRYHSYKIVHYIHYAVLVAATSMIGLHVYTTIARGAVSESAITAAPANSPPRTLYFQGKLNDDTNTPITAETNLRFAIYSSPTATGSAQLWREQQTVTPEADGTFRVVLGKKTMMRQNIFTDNPSLYLGIAIGNGHELQPRQPLANVTTASNANSLQGLKPITENNAGTRNVILALDSSGNLTIGGNAGPTFQATGGELTLSGQILTLTTNPGSNANVQIKPDGTGIIDMHKPLQNTTNYSSIPSAAGALAIDDMVAILATSSGQSALTINQNGSGPIISASAGGTAKFTLDSQGNGFFGGNISLNGNNLASSANSFTLLGTPININFGSSASALSLGSSLGTTTVNNSLKVKGIANLEGAVNATGLFTASGGITVPAGKTVTFADLKTGTIPFINDKNQLASDSSSLFWDFGNKRLGIGTNAPGSKLSISDLGTGAGTALVIDTDGNVFKASSSRRYKDDIKTLDTNALVLLNASPKSFRYTNTGTYDIGYMAEDLEMLGLTDLVIYDKAGKPDAIKYDRLSIYILEIVKQQQASIKALEDTAATIKAGYTQMQQITSNTLLTISEDIMIGGETLKEYITSIVTSETENEANTNSPLMNPVASQSAQTTQQPQASSSASLTAPAASSAANLLTNDNNSYINSATSSAMQNSETPASSSTIASQSGSLQPETASSFSGTLTANEHKSPLFQPGNVLNIKYEGPNTNYANIASFSADLAFVPNLKADYATFNQGLIALGPASLTDVGVSGKLSVGGNLEISNTAINTIGSNLELQPLRQGNLSIMGGMVVIDTEGNLNVNGNANFAQNVNVRGQLAAGIIAPVPEQDLLISLPQKDAQTASSLVVKNATGSGVLTINQKGDVLSSGEGKFNILAGKSFKIIRGVQADTSLTETVADGSAGTGVISAYERERTIRTPYVSQDSLIYVTATSNTQQVTPYVARQTANSFTVQIPSSVTKDITFNWWIVN